MGLGTCLIGFAVSAMQNDGRIKDLLKIPREEKRARRDRRRPSGGDLPAADGPELSRFVEP